MMFRGIWDVGYVCVCVDVYCCVDYCCVYLADRARAVAEHVLLVGSAGGPRPREGLVEGGGLFTDINNYQYFDLKNKHGALSFPCLPYKGYKIWGFTLNVLVDLFNSTLDAAVELEYPSEELIQELRERGQQ